MTKLKRQDVPAGHDERHIEQTVLRGRRVMMASRLTIGALIWLAAGLGMWLPLLFADNMLRLPSGLRLAFSCASVGALVWLLWSQIVRHLVWPQSLENAALVLERALGIPENLLINGFCFESRHFRGMEKPFATQTVKAALSHADRRGLGELWDGRRIMKWLILVVLLLLLWGFYALAHGRHMVNAFSRFALPLSDTPPAGSVRLELTPGQDVTVSEGDDVEVIVQVVGPPDALRRYPQIVWREDAETVDVEQRQGRSASMRPVESGSARFHHIFKAVSRPLAFRVFAADTYSSNIHVNVNRLPRILESQFHVIPPAYAGLEPSNTMGPPEPLSGLPQSRVEITVRLDRPAERLRWKTADEVIEFEQRDGRWHAATPLQKAGTYEIDVRSAAVDRDVTIASGTILLRPDAPPRVRFARDEKRLLVDIGQRLQFKVQAGDDFGLRQLQTTLRSAYGETASTTLRQWTYEGPPGAGDVEETLLLTVDSERFQPGNSYVLDAAAQDFCPQAHTGRSQPITLQVRGLDELVVSDVDPAAAAFEALSKAIGAQQTALGVTQNLLVNLSEIVTASRGETSNAAALKRHGNEVGKRQDRVAEFLTEAWDVSAEPRPSFVHELMALRDGEHRRTMEKIQALGELEAKTSNQQAAVRGNLESVERLQAYILERLMALKGAVARQSQADMETPTEELLGIDDLGLDIDSAVDVFTNELQAFAAEQKQIMHDRQMVMDLPPEDFSDEEQARLEELALDQSALAEILSNAVNDFTNLDLQDFGDNTMVENIKSVFEEAETLAETAAQAAEMRQTRVDAYRLETEAVEMAEEILINCEATMGFRDSIQFIAEIPEDEQLVAPLAELPWELEDLVGDLITSEQEMQPEVEDIGSYLNSLDHTAGPIADGTISSMSAKGKTGDQRPEDNIIQGRSGAGRSGMSDGQLVEPVAKALSDNEYGLRERMSNTPLESGQVRDEDTKAQTGGTGLGKTTDGSAMFGVGGQLPPKLLDMMQATAARQLEIRRSAREIVPKLKQHNLPTAELEQSIAAMQAVETALNEGDGVGIRRAYTTALDSLTVSRRAIGKHTVLQRTQDAALAQRLGEMQSQQNAPEFRGYEHIIRAYFEALAEQRTEGQN